MLFGYSAVSSKRRIEQYDTGLHIKTPLHSCELEGQIFIQLRFCQLTAVNW